ncbi:MAG: IS256 family transposase [Candidatus Dormibacteria bacterium]
MRRRYQVLPPTAPVPAPDDVLEQMVREGAQRMLQTALVEEVESFLGRAKYDRGGEFRGYRNGSLPERTIATSMAAVTIRQPRVSDVPAGSDPFRSEIVSRWERQSRTQLRLFARLYLEGLSSGDFEPVFRALVGETTALSPASILRLRQEWEDEYRLWRGRPLLDRYVYIFADGIYLKAGLEREKTAVLVVLGVRADGHKELLAMQQGYRESAASWGELLRDLKSRGLTEPPLLAIGDGGLGFWAALNEVFPTTRQQRCWNHRVLNVIDKLPKRLQATARGAIKEIYQAPSRAECSRRRAEYCTQLRAQAQGDAADCLERDWDEFVTFYDFPEEHWLHLRTSNPIESIFAGVRLRTDATKRMHVRENALYLVFKLVLRLGTRWHPINGRNQLTLLLAGERFVDGRLQRSQPTTMEGSAA